MKTLIALFLLSMSAQAAEPVCREESRVRFTIGEQAAFSTRIGAEDPCDGFGGDLAFTPAEGIRVFVNFNIPGSIDLAMVDRAYVETANGSEWLRRIQLAVVTREWMMRVKGGDFDALLNRNADTLFISETVLDEQRLEPLLRALYGIDPGSL